MRSRGPGRTRSIRIASVPIGWAKASAAISSLVIMISLFLVFRVEDLLERVQSFGPEAFEVPDPFLPGMHRRRLETAEMVATLDRASDQAGILQHTDVLGCRCQRHRMRLRESPDQHRASGELP